MGFLSTQSTLLNLSGNSANLSTIQSGSSIVGISLSGSGYTLEMIFQTHGLVVFLINPLFNLMKMK